MLTDHWLRENTLDSLVSGASALVSARLAGGTDLSISADDATASVEQMDELKNELRQMREQNERLHESMAKLLSAMGQAASGDEARQAS